MTHQHTAQRPSGSKGLCALEARYLSWFYVHASALLKEAEAQPRVVAQTKYARLYLRHMDDVMG